MSSYFGLGEGNLSSVFDRAIPQEQQPSFEDGEWPLAVAAENVARLHYSNDNDTNEEPATTPPKKENRHGKHRSGYNKDYLRKKKMGKINAAKDCLETLLRHIQGSKKRELIPPDYADLFAVIEEIHASHAEKLDEQKKALNSREEKIECQAKMRLARDQIFERMDKLRKEECRKSIPKKLSSAIIEDVRKEFGLPVGALGSHEYYIRSQTHHKRGIPSPVRGRPRKKQKENNANSDESKIAENTTEAPPS